MIIELTKIEVKETKFVIETRFRDMVLWDWVRSPEAALEEARNQIKLLNFFRMNEHL